MLIGQISSTFDDRFPHVDPNSKETTLGEGNERVLKSDPDMTDRKSNLASAEYQDTLDSQRNI